MPSRPILLVFTQQIKKMRHNLFGVIYYSVCSL